MSGKLLTPATDPATVPVAAVPPATASGLPPTRGTVTMLVDMEETFTAMYKALSGARKRVLMCAWYLHFDTLINGGRNPPRFVDEIHRLVQRGVEVDILLSYIEGQAFPDARKAWEVRDLLRRGVSQAHVRFLRIQVGFHPAVLYDHYLGTYHEKLLIVDGKVAFCGGLEFNREYAKASPHRHDTHCRVEGPAVAMLERHVVAIWNAAVKRAQKQKVVKQQLDEAALTDFPAEADPGQTRQAVQWVFTAGGHGSSAVIPFTHDVTEVYDSYVAAIDAAQKYIYMENQYFRSDDLTRRLIARLKKNKELEVIVLIPDAPEEKKTLPSTRYALWLTNEQLKAFAREVPSGKPRVGVFSLCQGKNRFPYVHSKIMVVDDKWLTIGSANVNARGFYLDYEANLVIRDDDVARLFRRRLWKEHLGDDTEWSPGAGSALDLWLKTAARDADAIRRGQRGPASVIEHKYDPKIVRPSAKEIEDELNVPQILRPLLPTNELLRKLAYEPAVDETELA